MKVIVLETVGKRDARDLPTPKTGPGPVLVRICAAPLNGRDLLVVKGGYGSTAIHIVMTLLVTAAWCEPVGAQSGPSFDCAKARAVVERLVCAEADLARADRDMAAAYRRAVSASRTPADRDRLVRDQVDWLKWRAGACLLDGGKGAALPPPDERGWTIACLGVMYGYRTARLDDIAGLGHVPGPQSGAPPPSLAIAGLPGRYTAGGTGWYGTLTLARDGDGLGAAIETVSGPTAHTCHLEGKATVSGGGLLAVAYHDAQRPKPDERCTVALTPIAGGLRVAAQDGEACRYFCGARGNIDGDYHRAAPSRR